MKNLLPIYYQRLLFTSSHAAPAPLPLSVALALVLLVANRLAAPKWGWAPENALKPGYVTGSMATREHTELQRSILRGVARAMLGRTA